MLSRIFGNFALDHRKPQRWLFIGFGTARIEVTGHGVHKSDETNQEPDANDEARDVEQLTQISQKCAERH
jgi:hypothetical protein